VGRVVIDDDEPLNAGQNRRADTWPSDAPRTAREGRAPQPIGPPDMNSQ